jgi:hypothetical protein
MFGLLKDEISEQLKLIEELSYLSKSPNIVKVV